ncbi:MAG TPA: tryptophan--tRNA ligase [Thermoplasmata archaeon]|nr:tryptophan--tRNA ligase [Thermoplasmata archaeon]
MQSPTGNDPVQEANARLVRQFGASPIDGLAEVPAFYAFGRGLFYSHRDFDDFLTALKAGKRCALVTGFNPSGSLHLGHKAILDTSLFFQRELGLKVFIPISDDESYLSGKVGDLDVARSNAVRLARELLAYGFDPDRTRILIDQLYTPIYPVAIHLARKLTLSEVRAAYGYDAQENPGRFFYPAIQAAHILMPMLRLGFERVLVPIGPDEDGHLRIARDLASRFGLPKPAVLHAAVLPGLDGAKMSKSRENSFGLFDDDPTIRRKVRRAFSGGAVSAAEHRRVGGDPARDIAYLCLKRYFLEPEEATKRADAYRRGDILSGDLKAELADHLLAESRKLRSDLERISDDTLAHALMTDSRSESMRARREAQAAAGSQAGIAGA